MPFENYIIYFIVGIAPCIIWLLLYLQQDAHPESNKKIIEIFLLGALMVFPIKLLEDYLGSFFPPEEALLENIALLVVYYVVVIGFIEEFFKYLVVKIRIIRSSHFDEPIDAMLYLIIASLGLAAIENIALIFYSRNPQEAVFLSAMRLLTAIFLHTLAAGITGYFLALSLRHKGIKSFLIISLGLVLSSFFHGIYDVATTTLTTTNNIFAFLFPIAIILVMGIIVYILFLKVKKMPRSCNL